MEQKKQYIKVVEKGTNNEAILIRDVTLFKTNGKRFVKLFSDIFPILPNLTFAELKILIYILSNLKMKSKTIVLCQSDFDFHRHTYTKAINGLIQWDIITPYSKENKHKNLYYINTDFLFNGKI